MKSYRCSGDRVRSQLMRERVNQYSVELVSSSFFIAINCQIKEFVLDDFNLRVSHSRRGADQKSQSTTQSFSCSQYGFGYASQNARVFTRGGSELSINAIPQTRVECVVAYF